MSGASNTESNEKPDQSEYV